MLPKLRKSLQKNEKRISPPVLSQKTPYAIEAPKAVIRALYDYTQGSTQELSFSKGDFFHVVGNDSDENWYEACNPATGAKGLVPVPYFQVLGKNEKESGDIGRSASQDTGYGAPPESAAMRKQSSSQKAAPLYGVVQYDFQAERPDELDAKAGEAIIIIAQSNHEWFVAKPIGRLGGPGLIPVSFIQIRDLATGKPIGNLEEIAAKAAVPKVEEWKKAAAQYKNSSIPLGRFDFDKKPAESQADDSTKDESQMRSSGQSLAYGTEVSRGTENLFVARASVDQFLLDGARYWFLVRVEMNDGRHRNLCRYYEDFYDFQIALLEEFPAEAGRTGETRILPFMPGPLAYVDDTITAQRRADLNIYVEELCHLPAHVVRSQLVQNLFAAREGDVESSHPTSMMPQPLYRHGVSVRASSTSQASGRQQEAIQNKLRTSEIQSYASNDQRTSSPGESSVPQRGTTRNMSVANDTMGTSFVKLKVFFEDDLIAIRVASDIGYEGLCGKLRDRLSGPWQTISVKDESRGAYTQITDDSDFQDLLQRTDKIVLYVQ